MGSKIIHLLIITFVLIQACAKKSNLTENKSGETKVTTIKENISYVTAQILNKQKQSDTLYTLKILILQSNSDENMPSFATDNEEIEARPNFVLNESGIIDMADSRNQNLIELSKMNKGDTVNLTLTLSLQKGWLIINYNK